MEVVAKDLAEVRVLQFVDEDLDVLEVLIEEGLGLEEGRDHVQLIKGICQVLSAEVVGLQEVSEIEPLALRRLVLSLLGERGPLVDGAR